MATLDQSTKRTLQIHRRWSTSLPTALQADGEQYKTIEVTCSPKYTVAALKDICKVLKVSSSGKKSDLFKRLCDCGHDRITKKAEDLFEYKRVREAKGNVLKWLILTGVQTADIDGIDMGTGAQHGHFGPINKENAADPPKMEYLTPNCFAGRWGAVQNH